MYKFHNVDKLEDFLLESVGTDMLIPSCEKDTICFFHNGDKMTINTVTGDMVWEPICPGKMFTSRLSLLFHKWFGKGIIFWES